MIHDHLPPVPGRLHGNVNNCVPLGNELYVAISGIDDHGRVSVIVQNLDHDTNISVCFVSECILCDP